MRVNATPFSFLAAAQSGGAARGGVWAAGSAATNGKARQVRYAAVRAGSDADAQLAGHSLRVHARCPTFNSSGRADARRLAPRYAQ